MNFRSFKAKTEFIYEFYEFIFSREFFRLEFFESSAIFTRSISPNFARSFVISRQNKSPIVYILRLYISAAIEHFYKSETRYV